MSSLRTKPRRSPHWEDRRKPQEGPTRLSMTHPPHSPWSLPCSLSLTQPGTLVSLLSLQWSGLSHLWAFCRPAPCPRNRLPSSTIFSHFLQVLLDWHLLREASRLPFWKLRFSYHFCSFLSVFFRTGALHLLIHHIPYYLFCDSSVSSYCNSCMGQGLFVSFVNCCVPSDWKRFSLTGIQ